ncbi:MAG: ribonuclease III, partial [Clostridia bacterium]|nr:ribonuclease III [Clostridia bacterium]
DLTRMRAAVVSKTALATLVKELGLDKHAYIGRAQGVMSPKMSSDIYEAIVAAMYLDGGLQVTQNFIANTAIKKLADDIEQDYKSVLHEYAAKNTVEIHFDTESDGPSHKKHFVTAVLLNGKECGRGEGYSILEAEQKAAKIALNSLK